MPETPRKSFRLTESDITMLHRLARIWGPVQPLDLTEVIRQMAKRCLEIEEAKLEPVKKSRKNS